MSPMPTANVDELSTTRPDRGLARAVAVSTASHGAAKVVHLAANVGVGLAVLRYLGAARYGDFVVVITVTGLLGLFGEFGLHKLAIREVARRPDESDALIGTTTALRFACSAVAVVCVQAILLAMGATASVRAAAAVASLLFFANAVLEAAVVVFAVRVQQQYEAAVRASMSVIELVIVVALVRSEASLTAIVAAPVAAAAMGAAAAILIARRALDLRPRFDRSLVGPLLHEALPLAPALAVGVLYLKLDTMMVAIFSSRSAVSDYGAAYLPVEYLLLGSAVLIQVLFPLLARHHDRDAAAFDSVYRSGTELLLAVMLPVPLVLLATARPMIALLDHGDEFAGAAGPMIVLSFALAAMVFNAWHSYVMLAVGRQRTMLRFLVIATVANIAIDIPLVIRFDAIGAAWGTLLTSLLLSALALGAVRETSGALTARSVVRLGLPLAALGAVVALFHALGIAWWSIPPAAAPVYVAGLVATGVLRPAELRASFAGPLRADIDLVNP